MIRLYRARWSTNVERVSLTLGLKGIHDFESTWITYEDRSEVERVSGQGLVPVLDVDGQVLVESMDIVRALDERYPQPPLFPADPARRAELDLFVEWFNRVWKGPPNQIEAELEVPEPDKEAIAALTLRMSASLDLFERMLSGRDFLFAGEPTAADVCAFPFLKYATLHDPGDDELFHLVLRDHQRDGRERPRLAAWIDRMNALPRP